MSVDMCWWWTAGGWDGEHNHVAFILRPYHLAKSLTFINDFPSGGPYFAPLAVSVAMTLSIHGYTAELAMG